MHTKNINFLLENGLIDVIKSFFFLKHWLCICERNAEKWKQGQSPKVPEQLSLPVYHPASDTHAGVSYTYIKAPEVFWNRSPHVEQIFISWFLLHVSHLVLCLVTWSFLFLSSFFFLVFLFCAQLSFVYFTLSAFVHLPFYHPQPFSFFTFFSLSLSHQSLQSCCWLWY